MGQEFSQEQLAALVKQLGPAVAAQLIEQSKGSRDGMLGLFGGDAPAKAPQRKKGAAMGQYALAWLAAGGAQQGATADKSKMAERLKAFGSEDLTKGLQESVFAAGGSTIVPEVSADWIEFLRPMLVLSELGAQGTTFKSEKVIGRQDGGVTFYWVDEGVALTKSTPATGAIKLKARKGGVLCDCSNDIIRNPAVGFDDVNLTNDMAAAAKTEYENQFINGTGASNMPKGLLVAMDQTQAFAKAGTSVANYIADIDKLVLTVDKTNRARQNRGFLMSPDLETALLGLRDTAGWVFRLEMLQQKTLRGMPYRTSTLVAAPGGSGKLIHGEFADLVIGWDTDAELSSTNAPRFAEDETTFKLIMRGDAVIKRPKSFACIKDY